MKKIKRYLLIFLVLSILPFTFLCNTKKEVKVGVLDSSLDNKCMEELNVIKYKDITEEKLEYPHGEKVLQMIKEGKQEEKIYYANIVDEFGSVNVDDMIDGLNFLKNEGVEIINISISFRNNDKRLEDAIKKCQEDNIIIVASIDNEYTTNSYPANYDNVIAVTGTDDTQNINAIKVEDKIVKSNSFKTGYITGKIAEKINYK